jgi:hypothetical protein
VCVELIKKKIPLRGTLLTTRGNAASAIDAVLNVISRPLLRMAVFQYRLEIFNVMIHSGKLENLKLL